MTDEMNKNLENEELTLEQLKDVSGGATMRESFGQTRYVFKKNEVEIIKEKKGLSLKAGRIYCSGELSDLGGTLSEIKAYLNSIGINVHETIY